MAGTGFSFDWPKAKIAADKNKLILATRRIVLLFVIIVIIIQWKRKRKRECYALLCALEGVLAVLIVLTKTEEL